MTDGLVIHTSTAQLPDDMVGSDGSVPHAEPVSERTTVPSACTSLAHTWLSVGAAPAALK